MAADRPHRMSTSAAGSTPLEGQAALDLYLAKIQQNLTTMKEQIVTLEKAVAMQHELLQAAKSDVEKNRT